MKTQESQESKTIYLVRINYKSGNSVEMWFEELEFKDTNKVRKIDYIPAYNNKRPIYINVEEIESIYQIDSKEI